MAPPSSFAVCPLLRTMGDPAGPCYDLSHGVVAAVHAFSECPLRSRDALLEGLARATNVPEFLDALVVETAVELRALALADFSAARDAVAEGRGGARALAALLDGGACADAWDAPAALPFERRWVSPAVGHGLFARVHLKAGFILGEYAGVLRSEAWAAAVCCSDDGGGGGDAEAAAAAAADRYRLGYPALDARDGSGMYLTARAAGGWMRLINHAPPAAGAPGAGSDDGGAAGGGPDALADPRTWAANTAFVHTFAAGVPRVLLVVTHDVGAGQQLLADYGREHGRVFL